MGENRNNGLKWAKKKFQKLEKNSQRMAKIGGKMVKNRKFIFNARKILL